MSGCVEGLLINGEIALPDGSEGIIAEHFFASGLRKLFRIGQIEQIMQAGAEIFGIFCGCDITIALVINHFRNASDAEAQTGNTASERFHDRIG